MILHLWFGVTLKQVMYLGKPVLFWNSTFFVLIIYIYKNMLVVIWWQLPAKINTKVYTIKIGIEYSRMSCCCASHPSLPHVILKITCLQITSVQLRQWVAGRTNGQLANTMVMCMCVMQLPINSLGVKQSSHAQPPGFARPLVPFF